ncbi:Rpn family recombination-promoting nuclease/putative transposase [Candidatus Poribacteria bacterium]|nr:Rpn family recombination-promoting nuclease/putative transposase [Candidatus Poribacteria bacterium]
MHKTQDTQIEHFPDRSLRRLLQDREYVRWLVQIVAPDIETFLDFSQITYQKRSFISKALQERESDVLLSVPFREDTDATDTDALLIYILKELEAMAQTTAEFLIEQGKAEGKQDAVLKLLQLQFQHVPETLSRQIRNIDNLTFLDTLLEQAMTVQSLEEIDMNSALEST